MIKGLLTFFIPLLYFLPLIIIYKDFTYSNQILFWQITGLIFTYLGIFLWVCSFINLGTRSFAVLPKAKVLQTQGIYKYFRHPLYMGIIFVLFGLSLAVNSLLGLIYTIFLIIPLNIFRAKKEEEILFGNFGQEYLNYKSKTLF